MRTTSNSPRGGAQRKAPRTFERATARPEGGGLALLLFLTGLAVGAGGFAMALADRISPEAEWIALQVLRLGVAPGVVIACGATMASIGLVGLSVARSRGRARAIQEDQGLIEQLSEDLVAMRGSLSRLQLEFAGLQELCRNLLETGQDQVVRFQELSASMGGNTGDAMFRLAASLDQLGARFEQRIQEQTEAHRGGFAQLERLLDETAEGLRQELAGQGAQAYAQPAPSAPSAPIEAPAFEPELHTEPAPAFEPEAAYEEPTPEPPAPPVAEPEDASLGLLDHLDDFGGFHEEPPAVEDDEPASLARGPASHARGNEESLDDVSLQQALEKVRQRKEEGF